MRSEIRSFYPAQLVAAHWWRLRIRSTFFPFFCPFPSQFPAYKIKKPIGKPLFALVLVGSNTTYPQPFPAFLQSLGLLSLPADLNLVGDKMMSAQDPFYIVKEEIQDSIGKLESAFHQWEQSSSSTGEYIHLNRELIASCESIEWQVDELDKAVAVAAKDPAYYRIDEVELEKRKRWTGMARNQVSNVRKGLEMGKQTSNLMSSNMNVKQTELMRLTNDRHHLEDKSSPYISQDNDEFISSESDRQLLLIKQQDKELDELSASVQRIGGVGLTIHEELIGQDRILEELNLEMETTSNRLDFVQKKVAMVMKKAGAKGQIMMIAFLIILFIILFVLVFFT